MFRPREFGHFLFLAEFLAIVVPLSLVFSFAFPFAVSTAISSPTAPTLGAAICMGLAALALLCGWVLSLRLLRGGVPRLATSSFFLWLGCFLGMFIAICAAASNYARPSEPYSSLWRFRQDFGALSLGAALLIPLAHLIYFRVVVR